MERGLSLCSFFPKGGIMIIVVSWLLLSIVFIMLGKVLQCNWIMVIGVAMLMLTATLEAF